MDSPKNKKPASKFIRLNYDLVEKNFTGRLTVDWLCGKVMAIEVDAARAHFEYKDINPDSDGFWEKFGINRVG